MQGYQIGLCISLFHFLLIVLASTVVLGGEMVMHHGKPFFPIGIYHYPQGLPLEPRLEELSRAGFNTVLSSLTTSIDFMDRAQEFGIGVIPTLGWNMILDPGGAESKKSVLRENINRLKDHPALLGYEAPDEIAWVDFESLNKPGKNLEALLQGYEFIKTIDPVNPVWMNHAPRNTLEYLRSYSEAGDILGTDIYPVPEGLGHSDLDQSLNCVGQYTEKLEQVGGGKPIYMVLQGFSWEDLPPRGSRMAPQPDWVETRFMAYDAVCHGTNGIIYWGMAYTEIGDQIWEHLKRIASELRDITPVILDSTRMPAVTDSGLEVHRWVHGEHNYVFVLNTQRDPVNGYQLELPPDWSGGAASVVFEDRSVEVASGVLTDSFKPLEVHIYTDDPRADLSFQLSNPGVLERGDESGLEVSIENRGESSTPPFNLTLSTGDDVLSRARITGLGGHSTRLVNLDWAPLEVGEFTLQLEADPDGSVEEVTRSNNRITISLTVSTSGPDLQVVSVHMPGQGSVCAEVANTGIEGSPPAKASFKLGSLWFTDVNLPVLGPGDTVQCCWDLVDPPGGALEASFTVDRDDRVEEMLEDNNMFTETLYLEDLTSVGPALHVRGLEDGNLWLIKYDPALGTLTGEDQCYLVWGIDDWIYPDRQPRGSRRESPGRTVTPMLMGLDGLWYIVIPNQAAETLVFEFRGNTSGTDDNHGRGWRIVRTEWVLEILGEFDRVVEEGLLQGADMSAFTPELEMAWDTYGEGNYTATLAIVEDYEAAGVVYTGRLLEIALEKLAYARSLGLEVASHERPLYIAGKILEAGRYAGAEERCITVIEELTGEIASIPEEPMAITGLGTILALGLASRPWKNAGSRT